MTKINLIQNCMGVLVTFKNTEVSKGVKVHSKMKVLEWSQHISNCKSMQIL